MTAARVAAAEPALRLLERGGPGGVFYLHGADEHRKARAVRALTEAHLDPATRDFNLDRLSGRELELETLASVLATPPMMAEWRVVVVTEVEALAGSARARDLLVSTAKSPPPGLALILACTPPSSARFYGDLARAARSLEFRPLKLDDVPGWLVQQARETLDVELEPGAARALAQAVGTDLGVLEQELGKLAEYAEEGRAITREDVAAAGTHLPSVDRWEWVDLVGFRRFPEALAQLRTLIDQGESPVGLVHSLATHLLRIGVVRTSGPQALAAVLPPRLQRFIGARIPPQARAWTAGQVASALDGLRRADRRMKSSSMSGEALLQSWLLECMAGGA
ncbi:MAG: DNA polymerase III subunit delta [Longimicrobiales bacterium]|nr:DNA polymerase III subunit delta [Longimicrobiales bacterium]